MKKLTKKNLRNERDGSGVYRIYNSSRKLIYVGRASKNIKHNLVQHFGSKHYTGAKFGARYDNFYSITLLPRHRIKKREKRAIRRHKPRGNMYRYRWTMIEKKAFRKYNLEEDKGKEKHKDVVVVRLNKEERKELEEVKEDLNINADSKALKIAGLKVGRNVLQTTFTRPILKYLFSKEREKLEDFNNF